MSVLTLGLLFGGVTLAVMFSGMPIAFSLGFVAVVFIALSCARMDAFASSSPAASPFAK